ncbi:hypothetical protein [Hungatella hathewayi]|uniref:hypothetical protein n=1 Tax=Hungatella hathewayi TaxID=154046 RepID=UPI00356AC9E1
MREFENRLYLVTEGMEQVIDTVDDLFDKAVKTAVMVFMMLMTMFMSVELMSFKICCTLPLGVKCLITLVIMITSYKIFNFLSKFFFGQ